MPTINGKEYVFFIKFGKQENLEKLRNGQLYMKNAKFYRDLEEESGHKGMGDQYEGAIVSFDVPIQIDGISLPNATVMKQTSNIDDQTPIFCCSCFTEEDLEYYNKEDCWKLKEGLFDWDTIASEFGEYALIIPHPRYFLGAIIQHCENSNMDIRFKEIQYVQMDESNAHLKYYNNNLSQFFIKDDSFRYQKEFRILLANQFTGEDKDYTILDVGRDFRTYTVLMPVEGLKTAKFQIPNKNDDM